MNNEHVDTAPLISVLVVSRTPYLLASMLLSLNQAFSGSAESLEVLCSWNGDDAVPDVLKSLCRYSLSFYEQRPYHFSRNVNYLSTMSRSKFLLFLNDDVILDSISIDNGLSLYDKVENIGIIGAYLRRHDDVCSHVGVSFNSTGHPYHTNAYLPLVCLADREKDLPVPAVTGACLLILRSDFEQIGLNPEYVVYGQDIELCLSVRERLKKTIWCCHGMSGIHEESSTRKLFESDQYYFHDSSLIMQVYNGFKERSQAAELVFELTYAQNHAYFLSEYFSKSESPLHGTTNTELPEPVQNGSDDLDFSCESHDSTQMNVEFHISSKLRHEHLSTIKTSVMAATHGIAQERQLCLQIMQLLVDGTPIHDESLAPILDIFYERWQSLVLGYTSFE